jgi:phospholipase DDHD1
MSFPEFHVDWMSPEEVYLHRETTSSQLYRGLSASLGFRKPVGERLFRGYKELCAHTDRLADISHIVFVVHGVGQVNDDTTIIRNTNIMRDNLSQILAKQFPRFQVNIKSLPRLTFFGFLYI